MSRKILITGATGNVGYEVINGLYELKSDAVLIAGAHRPEIAKNKLSEFPELQFIHLDLADTSSYKDSLKGIDSVFLIRPPNLANMETEFEPFIRYLSEYGVKKIVFLSVQGAEKLKRIPHSQIERLILKYNMDWVFIRPSYFMQNLTSTLYHEIKQDNTLYMPSKDLKFTWVDVKDIGYAIAVIMNDFDKYKNNAYEITGKEIEGFDFVAKELTEMTGEKFHYISPNPITFFLAKRKQGIKPLLIIVMLMLHFVPRFDGTVNKMTDTYKYLTGREPGTIRDFLIRNIDKFRH